MSEIISIRQPQLLQIYDAAGLCYYGGDQSWYPSLIQRQAGCGPTVCAHLLWYLSARHVQCGALCTYDCSSLAGFRSLMLDTWNYVTPGYMGVNTAEIFTTGALLYGQERGVPLTCRVLEIPTAHINRPSLSQMADFLASAFAADLPVAFLNLSNGSLSNLDHWHWVTLLDLNQTTLFTLMYDQGKSQHIDIALWLKTTSLGGALVVVEPQEQS